MTLARALLNRAAAAAPRGGAAVAVLTRGARRAVGQFEVLSWQARPLFCPALSTIGSPSRIRANGLSGSRVAPPGTLRLRIPMLSHRRHAPPASAGLEPQARRPVRLHLRSVLMVAAPRTCRRVFSGCPCHRCPAAPSISGSWRCSSLMLSQPVPWPRRTIRATPAPWSSRWRPRGAPWAAWPSLAAALQALRDSARTVPAAGRPGFRRGARGRLAPHSFMKDSRG